MISSDLQLKQHVEDELSWELSVNAAAIGVSVRDAIVTLSGMGRAIPRNMRRQKSWPVFMVSGQ